MTAPQVENASPVNGQVVSLTSQPNPIRTTPPPAGLAPRPQRPAGQPQRPGRWSRIRHGLHGSKFLGGVFYSGVVALALIGGGTAAESWLHWPMYGNFAVVGLWEVGGAYLLTQVDERRQLGERAIGLLVLAFLVNGGAVALNWFGHYMENMIQAAVFAGFSALGFLVFLTRTEQKRRDRLRATGAMNGTGVVFGLMQTVRHPFVTAKARDLALANPPVLDDEGKVVTRGMNAAEALEAVKLHTVLSRFIYAEILAANPKDKDRARASVEIFDPVVVARLVQKRVDREGMADILATRIDPRAVLDLPGKPKQPPLPKLDTKEIVKAADAARQPAAGKSTKAGLDKSGKTPAADPADTSAGSGRRPAEEWQAEYERRVAGDPVKRTEKHWAEQLGMSERNLRDIHAKTNRTAEQVWAETHPEQQEGTAS